MSGSRRVLVTGAAGNLGQSVVRMLLANGDRVRAFDLPTKANEKRLRAFGPNVEVVLGDVTKPDDVARAVDGVDAVAHLAGLLPPVSERHPARTRAVNVEGTRTLVRAMERAKPGAPFVLTSSYTVYGPGQAKRGLANDASPTEATDEYTASKLEAEAIVRESSLAWVILRVAAAIEGSASVNDPIVIRLMFEVAPDQPIELVHGEDVATAIVNAVGEPRAHRRIFPIGGGPRCRITQRELFELSFGVVGVKNLPISAFGASPYYTCYVDTDEAQQLLRFQNHDLDAIRHDLVERLGPLVPLAKLASPLVKRILLHFSGPYRGEPARPSWKAHIEAGH